MKKILLIAVTLVPFLIAGCTDAMKSKDEGKMTELKTPAEKLGYALGSDIGKNFKKNEMEIDSNAFVQGFKDGMTDAKPLLTPDEIKEIQKSAITEMRQKLKDKRKMEADKNKTDGEAFLEENKKKPGVITTDSGLQYEVLTEGTGPIPKKTDRVQVNYAGKLLDGTEFDSSYKRGKPSTFGVTGVIAGWTEALQKMKVGSKWRLYVPSELAYKDRGAGQNIGPNAALIFDIELIAIEEPVAKEAAPEEAPAPAKPTATKK